jgi:glycogen synthase
MRVLMTADTVGGVWQYALQLATLLSRQGVRVMLATMGPEPSAVQRAEAAAVPRLVLRTSTFALEWMEQPWGDVDAAAQWLRQLETEFLPDVVHLNGYAHAGVSWHAPTLVVAHSCVLSWWNAVHGSPPPAEWDEYVVRVRAGLLAATTVVAPTQAMADALTRIYHLQRPVSVIPNCRDADDWRPSRKEPFIFSAGRAWDPAKNVSMLNRVAADLDWPILVAGAMNGSINASQTAGVNWVGHLDAHALTDWMGRASVYVMPARYEPFGLSVLEAALCGCALVLGDIPSLRENWSGVAQFVHPDDADELRRILQDLITDPAKRTSLGDAARDRGERFSPTSHVAAYERLYREMVTAHGRTPHSTRTL